MAPLDVTRAHIITDLSSNRPHARRVGNFVLIRVPLTKKHKRALGLPIDQNALVSVMVRAPDNAPSSGAPAAEFDVEVKE